MVFAALLVAAAVAVAPPDGTYSYSIEQASATIGSATVTVKHGDAGIQVRETQSDKVSTSSRSYAVDETLDPGSLAPRSYVGTYTQDGTPAVFRMAFDSSGARASVDGVSGVTSVPLPPGTRSAFVVELSLMSGYLFLPAQVNAAKTSKFAAVIPSELDAVVNRVDSNMNPIRPAGIPPQDISLSVSGGQMSYDEWYDPLSFVVHAVSFQNGVVRLTHYAAEVKS
jgi:hypothetical protein